MASNFWSTAELVAALILDCIVVYPILCRAISGSLPFKQWLEGRDPKDHLSELS